VNDRLSPAATRFQQVMIIITLVAMAASAAAAFRAPSPRPLPANATIEAYFAPGPDCSAALVREINAAGKIIRGQFYELTDSDVGDALRGAHARGVDVQIILDANAAKAKYSQSGPLARAGIPTFADGAHPIAHNKLLMIDGQTLATGSYNPTNNAKKNAENLQIQKHLPDLVAQYVANWSEHLAHSHRLTP
jgi:phosphatidylserine/phosphatidylglycerophosphate/cardiolipin synthase-like enzyme